MIERDNQQRDSEEIIRLRVTAYNRQLEEELYSVIKNLMQETGLTLEELKLGMCKIIQEPTVCFYYKEQLLLSTKTLKAFYDSPA